MTELIGVNGLYNRKQSIFTDLSVKAFSIYRPKGGVLARVYGFHFIVRNDTI